MRNHRQRLTPLDYIAMFFGWVAAFCGFLILAISVFRIIADKVM